MSYADYNVDGIYDLAIGAQTNDAGGTNAGRVYVYYGATGASFNTTADFTHTGPAAGARFGASIAGFGESSFSGTIANSFVIGAYLYTGSAPNGRVDVYYPCTTSPTFTLSGTTSSYWGWAVGAF